MMLNVKDVSPKGESWMRKRNNISLQGLLWTPGHISKKSAPGCILHLDTYFAFEYSTDPMIKTIQRKGMSV